MSYLCHCFMFLLLFLFFFFKQKTAYEMRISDWSSDVCSSDLLALSVVEAGSPRSFNARRMRGKPVRMPYSTQEKFGTSGLRSLPCGPGISLRGGGWSNGQSSHLKTTWTLSGLPGTGGGRRGTSDAICNGLRGMEAMTRPL